jgi:Tfp pilus assembly protein PilN
VRAVNLIPADERRRNRGLRSDVSGPTVALLGALVLALVAVLTLVMTGNAIHSRKDELAQIEAQTRATQQQAQALKPYADVAALRERSLSTIRSLAAQRFDWARVLADLSRRVPADVDLDNFDGKIAEPDASAPAGTPIPSTVTLNGCTTSHTAVARMMDSMRQVRGVTDVAFGSSQRSDDGSGGAGAGCPRSDQFVLTLTLAPETAPPADASAPAPTTTTAQ